MLCLVIPLVCAVIFLFAAKSLYGEAARLALENRRCSVALDSLVPYLESVSKYHAAENYLAEHGVGVTPPAMPMGVPAPKRVSTRGITGADGWTAVREEYSWDGIISGQAFAVLAKFTSPDVTMWRIAALDMSCTGDEGKLALSVTLECATRE